MNNGSWPQPLKNWVQRSLKEALPANKGKVNQELKKVIFEAYRNKTIDLTDWDSFELESIRQQRLTNPTSVASTSATPSMPTQTNGKRKKPDKDTPLAKRLGGTPGSSKNSIVRLAEQDEANEARRKRFAREHEIEMAKGLSGPQAAVVGAGHGLVPRVVMGLGGMNLKGKGKAMSGGGLGYDDLDGGFNPNVIDWDKHTIVGTSTKLEKKYLRLTSEPDPSTIRPLPVLIQTLDFLKNKWRQEGNYPYICDQFKSMRQDLTVQRIKNYFTVQVYEIHARIAMESKDLGELNQCQSALRHLYEHNLPGHPDEFLAYRILYLLYTRNTSELNLLLARLTPAQRAPACVQHALKVHRAMTTSNYHAFFVLFLEAPNMGGYLMDHFLDRERIKALGILSRAYMSLPITFIAAELAFETPHETTTFFRTHAIDAYQPAPGKANALGLRDDEKVWDCKGAWAALGEALRKTIKVDIKGQL